MEKRKNIFEMKNKVDPEIPLVRVAPNNASKKNDGFKMVNKKKRRSSGQFSISNMSNERLHQNLDKGVPGDRQFGFASALNSTTSNGEFAGISRINKQERDRSKQNNDIKMMNESFMETINPTLKAVSKWKSFVSTRRCSSIKLQNYEKMNLKQLWHRDFDNKQNTMKDECFGFLEESEDGLNHVRKQSQGQKQTKKALISYFVTLANPEDEQTSVDFNMVDHLLQLGADINMGDKYGQTILHEVARIWHRDVAKFLIERGAQVDAADSYGRTPLHVAAAVDYTDMVNYLLEKDANIHARTVGEYQTPIHYAAKNDACNSLTALIDKGASIDGRDFKGRTPLQVAAELDRSETCKILLNEGAPAGVWDDSGMSTMALMIMKMPPVALKALDQFHVKDRANRKQYFYLNCLETPLSCPDAKSCLKVAVEEKQYSIIMHPVMQRLTETKWKRFGKTRAWYYLLLNALFCIIWTFLLCTSPPNHKNIYNPLPQKSYRIFLDVLAVSSLIYWFVSEAREYRTSLRERNAYMNWRENELTKDIQYCHPRWPEERAYIEREITELEEAKPSYFVDWWNYFDWLTYASVIATIIAHIVTMTQDSESSHEAEKAIGAIMLILQWIRLMKFVRAFRALGPFVVILRHVMSDTARFAFLFFEFYIPYSAAMWILFGSKSVSGYSNIEELLYNLLQITVIGDYGFSDLAKKSGRTARLLCGTYIVLSGIVCLNLFIALLSDTFQRVYDNAQANAQMLRAARVLNFEDNFAAERREKFRKYIERKCAPEVMYYDDDMNDQSDVELKRMTHQIKQDLDKVSKYLQGKFGVSEEDISQSEAGKNNHHTRQHLNKTDTDVLAKEMTILKSNYEHSMKIINIQLLSMNTMLSELSNRKRKKERKRDRKLPNAVKISSNAQKGKALSTVIPMPRPSKAPERDQSNMGQNRQENGV